MKKLLVMLAAIAFAPAAFATVAEYTAPSLYHCETHPKSLDALDQCAQENLVAAQDKKAPLPHYNNDLAKYFFDGLTDLQQRKVAFTTSTKALSNDDALFRRHLGEWLYFTQASAVDDGKKPADYTEADLGGFATVQVYPQADGSFLVFYWDYNGASNSAYQVVRISAKGVKALSMENYDETSKKITVEPVAYINDFRFTPKTNELVSSVHDGYNRAYNGHYTRDGDLFRLKLYTLAVLSEKGGVKTTTLYKAP